MLYEVIDWVMTNPMSCCISLTVLEPTTNLATAMSQCYNKNCSSNYLMWPSNVIAVHKWWSLTSPVKIICQNCGYLREEELWRMWQCLSICGQSRLDQCDRYINQCKNPLLTSAECMSHSGLLHSLAIF